MDIHLLLFSTYINMRFQQQGYITMILNINPLINRINNSERLNDTKDQASFMQIGTYLLRKFTNIKKKTYVQI